MFDTFGSHWHNYTIFLFQKFTCDSETYKLNPNNCQIENRRGQRQTPRTLWTSWKVLSGCTHSCISNAPGLRLVTRECLAPSCQKGLRRSVQLCNDRLASSSHHCTKRISVQEFTNKICSKYKVRRAKFTFYRKIILMLPIFLGPKALWIWSPAWKNSKRSRSSMQSVMPRC